MKVEINLIELNYTMVYKSLRKNVGTPHQTSFVFTAMN